MKRKWSYQYLERKLGSPLKVAEWGAKQCKTFAAETGVPWTVEIRGSDMAVVFSPVMRYAEIVACPELSRLVHIVLLTLGKWPGFYVEFSSLFEAIPHHSPVEIMGACKSLVEDQIAYLEVNRQGKTTLIKVRKEHR